MGQYSFEGAGFLSRGVRNSSVFTGVASENRLALICGETCGDFEITGGNAENAVRFGAS